MTKNLRISYMLTNQLTCARSNRKWSQTTFSLFSKT